MIRSSLGRRVGKLEGDHSEPPILWGRVVAGGTALTEAPLAQLADFDTDTPGASMTVYYSALGDDAGRPVMRHGWRFWQDVGRAWADAETQPDRGTP